MIKSRSPAVPKINWPFWFFQSFLCSLLFWQYIWIQDNIFNINWVHYPGAMIKTFSTAANRPSLLIQSSTFFVCIINISSWIRIIQYFIVRHFRLTKITFKVDFKTHIFSWGQIAHKLGLYGVMLLKWNKTYLKWCRSVKNICKMTSVL